MDYGQAFQAAATIAVAVVAAVGATRTAARDRRAASQVTLIDALEEARDAAEERAKAAENLRLSDLADFTARVAMERAEGAYCRRRVFQLEQVARMLMMQLRTAGLEPVANPDDYDPSG